MRLPLTLLAGTFATLLMGACGSGSDADSTSSAEAVVRRPADQEALTIGQWRVRLTVRPSRIGPIVFAARNLASAKRTNSDPWIEHDLLFRNTGNRPVTFADTRSSEFIGRPGKPQLLAADEGCGYARNSPTAPARAGACLTYLDLLTVKPHATVKRSVTLYEGLPGMGQPVPGTYVFRRPVRFQPGSEIPGESEGRSGVVRLTYQLEAR